MIRLLALSLVVTSLPSAAADSIDWNQWRGPQRDGTARGFTVPPVWPKALSKRWTVEVGEGHSSPLVVKDRVYILTRQSENEVLSCLNLDTGAKIWEYRYASPFNQVLFPARSLGRGPRATPLVADGTLYAVGINGELYALDAASGRLLWRNDFKGVFNPPIPNFGASASPLLVGDTLVANVGGNNNGWIAGFDRRTGGLKWKWEGDGPGYTSPIVAELGGERQLVTMTQKMCVGLSLNGKLLWSVPYTGGFCHNSIQPIVKGDLVVFGGNLRSTFAVKPSRSGDTWNAEKVWETRDVTQSTTSPVLLGDRMLVLNEKKRGSLAWMDVATGRLLWSNEGGMGETNTLYDLGGQVLNYTYRGDLIIWKPDGEIMKEVARWKVADSISWASPALSGNRIVVKDETTLTLWEIPGA